MQLKHMRCCLRSVSALCLVFALVFLSTFSNVLEVEASNITEKLVDTVTWSWNINIPKLTPDDCNTFEGVVLDPKGNSDVMYYSWRQYMGRSSIFTTSKDAYAYKFVVTGVNNFQLNNESVGELRLALGTIGELYKGNCVFGTQFMSTMTPSMWYVSNNSEQNIYMAVMGNFKQIMVGSEYIGQALSSSGSATIKVYSYTKAEYDASLSGILSQGNTLQQQGNTLQSQGNTLQSQGNTLQQEGNVLQEESNKMQKEQLQTEKNILENLIVFILGVFDFLDSFFDNLINSVVRLFVPDKDELADIMQAYLDFFNETFGFLALPFDIFARFVEIFSSLGAGSEYSYDIVLPAFSIMGHEVWSEQHFNIFNMGEPLDTIFMYVRVGTSVILIGAFLNYCRDVYEKRVIGGNSV